MSCSAARSLMPRLIVLLASFLLLAHGGEAQAGYIVQSYTLNQSNVLPDGPNYGTVQLQAYDGIGPGGGGLSAGQVVFTVTINPAAYGSIGTNFGMDKFAFNSDLTLQSSNSSHSNYLSGPAGWSASFGNQNISGFGKFDVELDGGGNHRLIQAVFTVSNLGTNATPGHFLFGSTKQNGKTPEQGSVYFAAHVADFNDGKSHFIGSGEGNGGGGGGGTLQTPEPATMALTLIGFAGVSLNHGLRRQRRQRPQLA